MLKFPVGDPRFAARGSCRTSEARSRVLPERPILPRRLSGSGCSPRVAFRAEAAGQTVCRGRMSRLTARLSDASDDRRGES
jgi:hypothetical protein